MPIVSRVRGLRRQFEWRLLQSVGGASPDGSWVMREPLRDRDCREGGRACGGAAVAVLPVASTAAMRETSDAVPTTVAVSESRSTWAEATPATASSAACTLAWQCSQTMPPTVSVVDIDEAPGGGIVGSRGVGGTSTAAVFPVASTASTREATEAVPLTVANPETRLTCADVTPPTATSASSTAWRQWSQVMPCTLSTVVVGATYVHPLSTSAVLPAASTASTRTGDGCRARDSGGASLQTDDGPFDASHC